ncbi:hypothetical protein BLJ79_03460 [Arthrobacter sp. UCD-GKA]|uniref:hypothetical protein n=1 Tax=Arthrobacter sp. UCD-GKA TaxID=1913576 RepID=UPI0008DC98B2|nr:hypothetical protein [Arthrobacter sp. UCD-GKA]OIH85877.1 hypothetical protein BLJ79_03460 [Arthrobacter sp. UCD-GKA]
MTTGSAELAAKVQEKLVLLAGQIPEVPPAEPAPATPVAKSVAERAREKYDKLVLWIVSVLTAVGALIFGSLPFVELHGVDWRIVMASLLVAGTGMGIVLWAVTKGQEPIDASLGELKRSLDDIDNTDNVTVSRKRQHSWFHARQRSMAELNGILTGSEHEAHLGPGMRDIGVLIETIGDLKKALLHATVGWNVEEANVPDAEGECWPKSLIGRQAAWEKQKSEMQAIELRLKDFPAVKDATKSGEASAEYAVLRAQYCKLASVAPEADVLRGAGARAAISETLQTYEKHRTLILQEAAVAQLRGTFRYVRGWMLIGGLITLVGGTCYAFALANPAVADPPNTAVTVLLTDGEAPWKMLASCLSAENSGPKALEALLYSARDASGAESGRFSVIVTDPRCAVSDRGRIIDVAPGEGSYDLVTGAPSARPGAP